ncbi:MAG: T9SS type A sorting domain-containing protein [Fibrobacteres bacterium]|nr:T9SS type A sorting domain-containing protein [Fibrobacterota bacterium]
MYIEKLSHFRTVFSVLFFAGSLNAVQLPAWVPDSVGEAGFIPMTNKLDDVDTIGTWSGAGPSNFADYSGGCYNSYYGPLGAHIIHGGGHAGSNDNSVFIANYNTLAFERVGNPTGLASSQAYNDQIRYGGFTDDISNPREIADNVPGSAHTYDCLLTLPPAVCGDSLGALIRPVAGAIGTEVSRVTGWSHVFTFSDRKWHRWSTNYAKSWNPGGTCAYDTKRGKIWPISGENMTYRACLDLSTRTFTNIWGHRGMNSYPDMVYSTYHVLRDIIVIATNGNGDSTVKMFWFKADSTGGERTPVTFSTGSLPHASWGRGSIVYVPELQKLIYWTQTRIDSYYVIDVPENPASAWSYVVKPIFGAAKPSTLNPVPRGSTYHRMDYSPQLKSLVWVTGTGGSTTSFGGRVVCIRVVGSTPVKNERAVKTVKKAIQVSPYPANGWVNIHIAGISAEEHLEIYNPAGVLVTRLAGETNKENGVTFFWQTGATLPGIYLAKCRLGNQIISRKILLVR